WAFGGETPSKPKLEARLEEYRAKRMIDDWVGVYDLVDPAQKKAMPVAEFLSYFGHGYIRLTDFKVKDGHVDEEKATGTTIAATKATLVPDRLPPQYRKGLRMGPDDNGGGESDLSLDWVWKTEKQKDGSVASNWFFRLDQEVVSGKSQ